MTSYEKAIEHFSKAIELSPDFVMPYIYRGNEGAHLKKKERRMARNGVTYSGTKVCKQCQGDVLIKYDNVNDREEIAVVGVDKKPHVCVPSSTDSPPYYFTDEPD